MTRNLVKMLTLGAILTGATFVANAQSSTPAPGMGDGPMMGRHHGRKHGNKMRIVQELGLTEAQQTQIKSIRESHRAQNQGLHTELKSLRQQKRTANGQLDATAQQRLDALQSQMKADHEREKQEIANVLTSEQRAKMQQLKADRMANRPVGPDGQPLRGRMGRMGRGHMGMGALNPRMAEQLGLTAEQQQRLQAIRDSYATQTKATRDEMRTLMQTRMRGGQLSDTQQARAKELSEQLRAANQQMRDAVQNVLTPEQRERIKQFRRGMHRDQMNPMGGTGSDKM